MSFSLKLEVERPRVLFQQDAQFVAQLTNTSRQAIPVDLPPMNPRNPIVRILDLETGVEREHRREPGDRSMPMGPLPMAPKQQATASFSLSEFLPSARPGKYEVAAVWEWGEGHRVESNAVEVELLPTTARADAWVSRTPGRDDELWGVWVDVAGDEPQVVRSRVVLGAGGGVRETRALWPCKRRARPMLSTSFPGQPMGRQWVAWVDGGDLIYGHVDMTGEVSKLRKQALPRDDALLAAPLHCEDKSAGADAPVGAALLVMGPPGGAEFGIQAVALDKKATAGGVAGARGPRPDHVWSHVFGPSQRWVTMLQSHGTTNTLLTSPWPGLRRADIQVTDVASWEGRVLAADSRMLSDGRAGGSVLLHSTHGGSNHLEVVTWALRSDGLCEVDDVQELAWEWHRAITDARIARRHDGRPGALMRDAPDGQWWCWDGARDPEPVGGEWCRTDQPLGLGFLGGCADPLVVGGRFKHGWGVAYASGKPLPTRMK
jgi:hypothetical protein